MCSVSERLVSESSELVLLRASVLEETDDLRERLKLDIDYDKNGNITRTIDLKRFKKSK